jgi:hypothetical protein
MSDRPANKPSSGAPHAGLALRFISGKYQGGEYPLEEGRTVTVGRSSELDMVLVEEMVSRRHARITVERGEITIEDLGSTNGTFVNGEKIQRAPLDEGDRVLIGTSILRVVAQRGPADRQSLEHVAAQRASRREEPPRMSGSLEEIPLPDLLQLFGTSKKDGVLVLRTPSQTGRIYLKAGLIHHVVVDTQPELPARKAAYRMLDWASGSFELEPPDPTEYPNPLDATAHEILMEGFRQLDELNVIKAKLPPFHTRLTLRSPLEAPLHELEPEHLDVLQLALNSPTLASLFDRSEKSDLKIAEIVKSLVSRGYLTSAK